MTPSIITDFIADPKRTLQGIADGRYPRPGRPAWPAFSKRRSLTELRPRHLEWVEEIGIRPDYDRDEMRDYMMMNYDAMFGPLRRPKSQAVPSDTFRKGMMVARLLSLIELRREEIAANVLPGNLPV